jgi:serine/threonine protein kinase
MDPAVAAFAAPADVVFHDGLGDRRQIVDPTGNETLEVLCLRSELTAVPSFEFALRERVSRLASFRHAYFGRVRSVDRLNDQPSTLALVSERTPGVRLSDLLAVSELAPLPIDINAALCLIRQLVPAVATLHENARDAAHGSIAPERIIVGPNARLVIVEHVMGAALEQLRFSHERYWKELRIALPRSAGSARFDHRADITAVGVVAVSLILGRPLREDEYPMHVADAVSSAWAISARGGLEPLPAGLRSWLARALQLEPRTSFTSALEARDELDKVLGDSDYIAAPAAVETFLTHYHQTVDPPPPPARVDPPPAHRIEPPPGKHEPSAHKVESPGHKFESPAHKFESSAHKVESPVRKVEPPAAKVEPHRVKVEPPSVLRADPPVKVKLESPPVLRVNPPVKAEPPPVLRVEPPLPKVEIPVAPLKPVRHEPPPVAVAPPRQFVVAADDRELDDPVGPAYHAGGDTRRRNQLIATVAMIAIVGGGGWAASRLGLLTLSASTGTLSVATNPPGAQVAVDGQARGVTPVTMALTSGTHTLEVRGGGEPRTIPMTITAGAQVSQYIELPKTVSRSGQLQIRSEPAGAAVSVDGVPRGAAPLTVPDLAAGEHTIAVESDLGSAKQSVTIEAGVTASLVVPLTRAENVPVSGWIAVSAPAEVQLYENKRLIGTSQSDRLLVSAGKHEIEIVNDALGYRATRTVQVPPGKVAPMKLEFPKGTIALNAVPWAEVWIDGVKAGDTPIGNLAVTIGPHEIVFRHPDLGEQKHQVTVTLGTPARLSVDLRKK